MADNDGKTHGYVWSDGQVHDHPEELPKVTMRAVNNGDGTSSAAAYMDPQQTMEHNRAAYRAWARGFVRWEKAFDAWEAKHGKR